MHDIHLYLHQPILIASDPDKGQKGVQGTEYVNAVMMMKMLSGLF